MKNEIFQTIFHNYENEIEKLYQEESACLLIFRILPKITQQFIMRLINIDNEIKLNLQGVVQEINWSDIFDNHENNSKDILKVLHLIKIIPDKEIMILNTNFKNNMLKIIKNGITMKSVQIVKKKIKGWNDCFDKGLKALEKYLVKIHDIENFNIETEDEKIKFLINSNIIKKEFSGFKLTHFAYSMLLADRQYQIRMLMIKYILTIKSDEREKNFKFLNFLFSICTLDIGIPYSVNSYDENTIKHLETFHYFGIISVKKKKRFYITPLMKCLFEDMTSFFESQEGYKFLIVETNFKIYAYTNSAIEKAIIEFLFEIEYIFPGLIISHITRKSMRNVYKKGINAAKILSYLSMHSHPRCNHKTIIKKIQYNVPENVAQQIIIWEEEKNAITHEYSIYLSEFADEKQYDKYLELFRNEKIPLLWHNKDQNIIIIPHSKKNLILLNRINV